jgi:hypothetical protein
MPALPLPLPTRRPRAVSRGRTVGSSWARRAVHASAGLAVSALALWYTLRGKDLGAVWGALLAGDVLDTRGVALANLYWGGQFALQTGVGLVFLLSRHVRLERILDAAAEVEEELEEEAAGKDAT